MGKWQRQLARRERLPICASSTMNVELRQLAGRMLVGKGAAKRQTHPNHWPHPLAAATRVSRRIDSLATKAASTDSTTFGKVARYFANLSDQFLIQEPAHRLFGSIVDS